MPLQQACHKESQLLHMSKVFGQTLVWELLGLAEAGGNFHPVHQGCLKASGYEMPSRKKSDGVVSLVVLRVFTFAYTCMFMCFFFLQVVLCGPCAFVFTGGRCLWMPEGTGALNFQLTGKGTVVKPTGWERCLIR